MPSISTLTTSPTCEVALADDVVPLEGLAADLRIGRPRGAARRAGLDHEAGLQRVEVGEEGDDLGDAPDHLRRGVVLADLAVDERPKPELLRVGDLVARDDPGPERRGGVEVLARAERVLEAALGDAGRPGGRAR